MEVIRDKDGNVIRRGRNLACIRRFVADRNRTGRYLHIKKIDVSEISGGGKLCMLFEDGASYETNFASLSVLAGWVRRWRAVHGAPLSIGGVDAGVVHGTHEALYKLENDLTK